MHNSQWCQRHKPLEAVVSKRGNDVWFHLSCGVQKKKKEGKFRLCLRNRRKKKTKQKKLWTKLTNLSAWKDWQTGCLPVKPQHLSWLIFWWQLKKKRNAKVRNCKGCKNNIYNSLFGFLYTHRDINALMLAKLSTINVVSRFVSSCLWRGGTKMLRGKKKSRCTKNENGTPDMRYKENKPAAKK